MHLLNVTTASLDDLIEPVDLGQRPAEMVAASFSDSDLGGAGGGVAGRGCRSCGWRGCAICGTRCRSISGSRGWRREARVVVVRLLGGYDWWAYGCDRLAAVARERGIALALLPGECREDDARLAALSTVPGRSWRRCSATSARAGRRTWRALLGGWRAGREAPAPAALPRAGVWLPGAGVRAGARRGAGGAAGGAGPLLPLDAARGRRRRRSRRWRRRWRPRGSRRCRCSCRACATRRCWRRSRRRWRGCGRRRW